MGGLAPGEDGLAGLIGVCERLDVDVDHHLVSLGRGAGIAVSVTISNSGH